MVYRGKKVASDAAFVGKSSSSALEKPLGSLVLRFSFLSSLSSSSWIVTSSWTSSSYSKRVRSGRRRFRLRSETVSSLSRFCISRFSFGFISWKGWRLWVVLCKFRGLVYWTLLARGKTEIMLLQSSVDFCWFQYRLSIWENIEVMMDFYVEVQEEPMSWFREMSMTSLNTYTAW